MAVQVRIRAVFARVFARLRRGVRRLRRRGQRRRERADALRHQVPARHGAGHAERPDGGAVQGARRRAVSGPRARRGLPVGAAHGGHRVDRGARVRRGADDRDVAVAVSTGSRTKFQVFDLPFLFPNLAAVERFQQSAGGPRAARRARRARHLGPAVLAQRHEAVLRPAAVDRAATTRAGSSSASWSRTSCRRRSKPIGGSPQKMAFGEVYQALQTGTVDAQENTWSNIYSSKFYEVQPYITETQPRLHRLLRRRERAVLGVAARRSARGARGHARRGHGVGQRALRGDQHRRPAAHRRLRPLRDHGADAGAARGVAGRDAARCGTSSATASAPSWSTPRWLGAVAPSRRMASLPQRLLKAADRLEEAFMIVALAAMTLLTVRAGRAALRFRHGFVWSLEVDDVRVRLARADRHVVRRAHRRRTSPSIS